MRKMSIYIYFACQFNRVVYVATLNYMYFLLIVVVLNMFRWDTGLKFLPTVNACEKAQLCVSFAYS